MSTRAVSVRVTPADLASGLRHAPAGNSRN